MTTSPGSPGPNAVESAPVPPADDRESPAEDDEMMMGGDVGPLKDHGHGRGHGRDEDDEDDAARRNVGG